MQEIIDSIQNAVNIKKGLKQCPYAAASLAWTAASGVNRGMEGMFEMAKGLIPAILGAPGLVKKLGGDLLEEALKELSKQAKKP